MESDRTHGAAPELHFPGDGLHAVASKSSPSTSASSSGRRDATRGKGEACTRLARLPVPDHCPCQAKDCPCAAKRTRPNLKFECNFHAHSTFFAALRKEFFGIRSFSPVEPRQSKCFFDLPAKEIETNVSLPKFKDKEKTPVKTRLHKCIHSSFTSLSTFEIALTVYF